MVLYGSQQRNELDVDCFEGVTAQLSILGLDKFISKKRKTRIIKKIIKKLG